MGAETNSCNLLASTERDRGESGEPSSFPFKATVIVPAYRKIRSGLFLQPTQISTPLENVDEPLPLHLQPGEWVQVRSIEEISATLDENDRLKGLYFMPEMEAFCGGSYQVMKRVETIKLESTGEVRRILSPTVFLDGVYCDGERHKGCDRACFHFWREAWLQRIPDK